MPAVSERMMTLGEGGRAADWLFPPVEVSSGGALREGPLTIDPALTTGRKNQATEVTTDFTWTVHLLLEGRREQASSEQIVEAINGVNALLKNKSFDLVDQVLSYAPIGLISPEIMVALARTTYPVRRSLGSWRPFVARVRTELQSRNYDAPKILSGLV